MISGLLPQVPYPAAVCGTSFFGLDSTRRLAGLAHCEKVLGFRVLSRSSTPHHAAALARDGLEKDLAEFDIGQHDDAVWKVFYVVAPDGLCYWFGERQAGQRTIEVK